MGIAEYALIVVLVGVPILLIFFRTVRRQHWPILLIIWLIAIVGWLFVTERTLVDCVVNTHNLC